MYLLVADETNQTPAGDVEFFVYGALFFPMDSLRKLDSGMRQIRHRAGYLQTDKFKFDTRNRPEHVAFEAFNEAKSKVLDLCKEIGCKFIAHVILHEIMKYQDLEQRCCWAADYVFGRFNTFLRDANEDGICIIDNLPIKTQFQYLTDKFTTGLSFYNGKSIRLGKILMFGTSCVGASHANSAMDIVLGAFRYCINNPKNPAAAKNMMGKVVDLLWHERQGEKIICVDKGLSIRPKLSDMNDGFRKRYEKLFDNINELIKEA